MVELYDNQVRANNTGLVHFVKLPTTGGLWKAATIPFTQFKLPDWEEVTTLPPSLLNINSSAITKVQFKYQGNAGNQGTISVDNMVFIGATGNFAPVIMPVNRNARVQGINAVANNGLLTVTWNKDMVASNAQAVLIGLNGKTVVMDRVSTNSVNLNTNAVSNGMYFVKITGNNAGGERVLYQVPVTISR